MINAVRPAVNERPICFATGSIWRYNYDHNRRMEFLRSRDLGLRGLEITLSYSDQVFEFTPSKENLKWLLSLSWVSIHAPFGMIREGKVEEQMDRICDLYRQIEADNIIIHPDTLPDPALLGKYQGIKFSTENLPPGANISRPDIERILEKYPGLGFCLDTTHAFRCSPHETRALLDEFSGRLTQIHLSGNNNGLSHLPLQEASSAFMLSIQCLIESNAPLVIELEMGGITPAEIYSKIAGNITSIRNMFRE